MYRFLVTPRWIALHLAVLVAIPGFALLGRWQLARFHERRAEAVQVERAQAAAPAPLAALDQVGGVVAHGRQNRQVTVAGRYDPAHQMLARLRSQDGATGYYVITPLVTADGSGVLVNRGFLASADLVGGPSAVPAPAGGTVTVTGRLQRSEAGGRATAADLPAGQIEKIDSGRLSERVGHPLYAGYLNLATQAPPAGASPAPVPPADTSGDDNSVGMLSWQNMSYVVTWWLFAALTPVFWLRLFRRERAAMRAAATARADAAATDPQADKAGLSAADRASADV